MEQEKKVIIELINAFTTVKTASEEAIKALEELAKDMNKESKPKIIYRCDRRKCKECNPDCGFTDDITHAENFTNNEGIYIEEKESTTGTLEMTLNWSEEQLRAFKDAVIKGARNVVNEKPIESEWPYKEVDRDAKKGEYIKIVKPWCLAQSYKAGDIFKVVHVYPNSKDVTANGVGENSGSSMYFYRSEYVVLEGYKPPKK